jgi:hypothetical protein
MGHILYHVMCCATSVVVWMLIASSVHHAGLRAFLVVNAAISLAYHGYRVLNPDVPNQIAHSTALLKVDAVGATTGAALVFLNHPPSRLPLVLCGFLSGGSWLGFGETVSWIMHLGTHLILTRLAYLHFKHDFNHTRVARRVFEVESRAQTTNHTYW